MIACNNSSLKSKQPVPRATPTTRSNRPQSGVRTEPIFLETWFFENQKNILSDFIFEYFKSTLLSGRCDGEQLDVRLGFSLSDAMIVDRLKVMISEMDTRGHCHRAIHIPPQRQHCKSDCESWQWSLITPWPNQNLCVRNPFQTFAYNCFPYEK